MNTLPREKQELILKCLVDGMSIRGAGRVADVSRNTAMKLAVDAGRVCTIFQDNALRGLSCPEVQVDEVWSYIYSREHRGPVKTKSRLIERGSIWTWVVMDVETRLVVTWRVGDRSLATGTNLMEDLRDRLVGRMQLTTDGYHPYLEAVERVFGGDLDYARVVKQYGQSDEDHTQVGVVGTKVVAVTTETVAGNPDPGKMSTSLIERQNLNLRTNIRRFTRKTNAFSKKAENHAAAVGLHFFNYNFCLKHGTLGMTPAMAAGIADYPFGIRDVVEMVEGARPKPNRPKVYNRKGRQRRWPQS